MRDLDVLLNRICSEQIRTKPAKLTNSQLEPKIPELGDNQLNLSGRLRMETGRNKQKMER